MKKMALSLLLLCPVANANSLTSLETVVTMEAAITDQDPLGEMVKAIQAEPAFGLVLVGDGPQAPHIHRAISGIERIRYLGPRIPPEDAHGD